MAGHPRGGAQHVWALAFFTALTFAFFAPVLFQGKSFTTVRAQETLIHPWADVLPPVGPAPVQSDQAVLSYPWQAELTRTVRTGALPLWEPHAFAGGYPLYANGSSAQLYLPHLATAAVLSPTRAHDAFSALHLLLAGFLTYLFLRELGYGFLGGLLSGTAWALSSYNTAWLHFEVVAPVQVFLPLGLLLVHRAWRLATWRAAALAGAGLGLTMTAGHVLWLGVTVAVSGAYGAALFLGRPGEAGRPRACARLALLGAVSVSVAAVELLPLTVALSHGQRRPFSYAQLGSFVPGLGSHALSPPATLQHLFIPLQQALTVETLNLELLFAGTLTALLALVGLVSRGPGAALGRWLLLGFGLGAVGGPVTWLAYHLLPVFRVLWPYGRMFQWATFGVALLAGIGLDSLLARWAVRPHRHLRMSLGPAIAGSLVVAFTAGQLLVTARALNPAFAARQQDLYPSTGLTRALQSYARTAPWPARILPVSSTASGLRRESVLAPGNQSLILDVDLVGGYDSVIPQRTIELARYLVGEPLSALGRHDAEASSILATSERVRYGELTRFGISALVTLPGFTEAADWGGPPRRGIAATDLYAGKDGTLLALGNADGGARVVTEVVTSAEPFKTYTRPDFPWRTAAVAEATEVRRMPRTISAGPVIQRVSDVRQSANALLLVTHSSAPGLLVIPENWDEGWSAVVNGHPAPDLRINGVEQAVPVPAGRAEVVLRYRPPLFLAGASVTSAALLGVLVLCVAGCRRRRDSPAREPEPGYGRGERSGSTSRG